MLENGALGQDELAAFGFLETALEKCLLALSTIPACFSTTQAVMADSFG
jgi:hypothetical protein